MNEQRPLGVLTRTSKLHRRMQQHSVDRPTNGEDPSHSDSSHDSGQTREDGHRLKKMYIRFGAMIATSTLVMFILMYFNTDAWDHVR